MTLLLYWFTVRTTIFTINMSFLLLLAKRLLCHQIINYFK